jgi:lipopolysaccharide biosynthesis protein
MDKAVSFSKDVEMKKTLRPVALYLPQFHPFAENDEWWGKGFTEWTNVTKAKPLFKGHYQPHLPSDFGFYDLRFHEIMEQQASLAKEKGIYGFCFYHYWFNEKRLMNLPLDNWLKYKRPDFPFMFCWANENWTRTWDGLEKQILIKQEYGTEDDIKHINFLLDVFEDKRYIRIDNKPVFIIYKPHELPNAQETVKIWREIAEKRGMQLYICHMLFGYRNEKKTIDGFDASIDFEPFGIRRENIFATLYKKNYESLQHRLVNKLRRTMFLKPAAPKKHNIIDYKHYYENLKPLEDFQTKIYPSIVPGWDNTSRRKDNPTLILENNTPEKFDAWMKKIINDFDPYSKEENFVFINAWNEWAEGNHLEPCMKHGDSYLNIVKKNFG